MPRFPIRKRDPQGRYGPTKPSGRYYKPLDYHQPTAARRKDKTRWAVEEHQQFGVFQLADDSRWQSATQHIYSIVDNGALVLGEDRERVAMFPYPPANGSEWHGYPVRGDAVDRDVVDLWRNNGVITPHVRRKLERGDI